MTDQFPTELFDEVGGPGPWSGAWYGQQPNVPRVGWFDSVVMRHSRRVSRLPILSRLHRLIRLGLRKSRKSVWLTTWMANACDHYPARLEPNSNVANQSMKNCQVGQKTSPVFAAWTSFQKMHPATMCAGSADLVCAFQPSQSDQIVTKPISLEVSGQVNNLKRLGQKS